MSCLFPGVHHGRRRYLPFVQPGCTRELIIEIDRFFRIAGYSDCVSNVHQDVPFCIAEDYPVIAIHLLVNANLMNNSILMYS